MIRKKTQKSGRITDRDFNMEMTLSPRQKRKRRRGCPSIEAYESLAQTYIDLQCKLWPELVKNGELPKRLTDALVQRMARDSYDRFVEEEPPVHKAVASKIEWEQIGCSYNRYSDDNSNPRSLDQQLRLVLEAAARNRIFIPWEYCFFDAAVSARHPYRHGYQSVLKLLQRSDNRVDVLVIDELGRINRNQLETLTLNQTVQKLGKRLIGASDGFDSTNSNSLIQLSVMAMLHEQDSEVKRERVMRGMRDAWVQGKPLYEPGFGYGLESALGNDGKPKLNRKGLPENTIVQVPEEVEQVRRIFDLFTNKGKSMTQIARLLKKEQVGDRRRWTERTVRQILERPLYNGRERWYHSYKEWNDWQTTTKYRGEEEWLWREMPHLKFIDDELWERTQKRLALVTKAYSTKPKNKNVRRSDVQPKRLFRLSCQGCGQPLWLDRGGDRPVVKCLASIKKGGTCKNTGGRSLVVIEESLLNYILEQFEQEAFLAEIVRAGNAFIKEVAARPTPDVSKLEKRLKQVQNAKKRAIDLATSVEDDTLDEDEDSTNAIVSRITELAAEERRLKDDIRVAESGAVFPNPISAEDLQGLIGNLRELLLQEPEEAAQILFSLCGRVELDQEEVEGYRRPQWTAYFRFDLAEVALEIARQENCPTMRWWEFLHTHSWTLNRDETTPVRDIKVEERIAGIVGEMEAAGSSVRAIANALGVDSRTVNEALKLHRDGVKCYIPPRDLMYRRDLEKSKTGDLTPEIVRLRDEEFWPFRKIAKHLDVSGRLISQAYRQHHDR